MTQVKGTISRINTINSGSSSRSQAVIIKLVGDPTIYMGDCYQPVKKGEDALLALAHVQLAKPGDLVEFNYSQDFNNYIKDFVNHSLIKECEHEPPPEN